MDCGTTVTYESLLAPAARKSNGWCFILAGKLAVGEETVDPCHNFPPSSLTLAGLMKTPNNTGVNFVPSYEGIGDASECPMPDLETLLRLAAVPCPEVSDAAYGIRILDLGLPGPSDGYGCEQYGCEPIKSASLPELLRRCFRQDSIGRWCLCISAAQQDINELTCDTVAPMETMLKGMMGYYADIDQWYINYVLVTAGDFNGDFNNDFNI